MKNFVAYLRTSTSRQNLGIEAQRTSVMNYLNSIGGKLVDEVVEQESGKNDNREGLERAISICEREKCTLIIAKLCRLSRSVSFLFQLRDRVEKSNIEIKALDLPSFNTLTLGVWASMIQFERESISERTRLALAEKKRKGVVLGNPENLTDEARQKGQEAIKQKARDNRNNQRATALILEYRAKGWSYDRIAEQLNALNFPTSQGKRFTSTSVWRLYNRAKDIKNVA